MIRCRSSPRPKYLPMTKYEKGFFVRHLARFVRSWSIDRAKLTFVVTSPVYPCALLHSRFFK